MSYIKKNVRVLPDDADAFGRLNWRAYIRYCEEGEAGMFEKLGFNIIRFFKERRISFPRRAATFEYCAQVSPDSLIDIETSFKRIGKTSFTLLHTFYQKNTEESDRVFAATAEVTVVAFDHDICQKTELPRELLDALKQISPADLSKKPPQCQS